VLRSAWRSAKGRVAIAVAVAYVLWQLWLTVAAPAKLGAGLRAGGDGEAGGGDKVNVLVMLTVVPERFHVLHFQRYGRVSGTDDTGIELRGVRRADLTTVARPYWVRRVQLLAAGR
jgi:hypothetical protein